MHKVLTKWQIVPTSQLMSKIIIILTLLAFSNLTFSQEADVDNLEQRLNSLIENGVIDKVEAQKQLVEVQLAGQDNFHNQVRGVASTIKDVKIYQIVNEPLEIPSH